MKICSNILLPSGNHPNTALRQEAVQGGRANSRATARVAQCAMLRQQCPLRATTATTRGPWVANPGTRQLDTSPTSPPCPKMRWITHGTLGTSVPAPTVQRWTPSSNLLRRPLRGACGGPTRKPTVASHGWRGLGPHEARLLPNYSHGFQRNPTDACRPHFGFE